MLIFSISPLSLAIWDAWVPDPSYIVKKSQQDSVCNWKNAYNVRNKNTLAIVDKLLNCLTLNLSNTRIIFDPVGAE